MRMQELGQRLHDITKNAGDTYNATSTSSFAGSAVPLIARVYLKLGTWHWTLKPIFDEEAVKGTYMKDIYCLIDCYL